MTEMKFKKGDKVQTNELFKEEYQKSLSFRGIVSHVGISTAFPGSKDEIVSVYVNVDTFDGNSSSVGQDYLDLAEFSEDEEKKAYVLLSRFDEIHKRIEDIKKELSKLNIEYNGLKDESDKIFDTLTLNGCKILTDGKKLFIEK